MVQNRKDLFQLEPNNSSIYFASKKNIMYIKLTILDYK